MSELDIGGDANTAPVLFNEANWGLKVGILHKEVAKLVPLP